MCISDWSSPFSLYFEMYEKVVCLEMYGEIVFLVPVFVEVTFLEWQHFWIRTKYEARSKVPRCAKIENEP